MSWDGVLRLRGQSLEELAARHGGRILRGEGAHPRALASVDSAGEADLAPLLSRRYAREAADAARRGAALLVDATLASTVRDGGAVWIHPHAAWTLAALLDEVDAPPTEAAVGEGSTIAPSAVLGPRVRIGSRVAVGAGAVIGHPGFGWATGPDESLRAVPQLGGVVIEDDVSIGPLCTVDAGTLGPTRLRRGVKLDAHVHVGHNADIGEDTIVAAQCGFAGSVRLGRAVRVGGQAGIADHVTVGDGARIAAKSGVIGDVRAGDVVAGYPAVSRVRWLRGFAKLYGRVRAFE